MEKIAALLCALLLLSGCAREPEETKTEIRVNGDQVAVYDGELTDGVGEGALSFDGWVYEGAFTDSALLSGRVDGYPWVLVLAGAEAPGRYTGPVEDGAPAGEGVFRAVSGAVFTGEIRGMAAVAGDVSALPWSLSVNGSRYAGPYTGALANGIPQGQGEFYGENAVGLAFSWRGDWELGEPGETGELACDRLHTTLEGREVVGAYQGAGRAGQPEGEGSFRSVDTDGAAFTYDGGWHMGLMEGEGTLRYEMGNRFVRTGYFTAGSFTPTWIQAIQTLGTCDPAFTLTDAQLAFLEEHPEFWEKESHLNFLETDYRFNYDRELTIEKCFQEPSVMDEPRWMLNYSFRVINAVSGPIFSGGPVMTQIVTTDSSYTRVIRLLVPGRVEPLVRGQSIHAYAMPIGLSQYVTILGREQPVLLLLVGELYNGV